MNHKQAGARQSLKEMLQATIALPKKNQASTTLVSTGVRILDSIFEYF
jgi:hypothetical protein